MKKENLLRKGIKIAALIGVLAAGRAAVNYAGTFRALGALAGNRVSCADGVVSADGNYPYDAIGVFGAGIGPGGEPSAVGKKRLDGAAGAYFSSKARRIALVGDILLGKNYLKGRYGIADEMITVGRTGSINTASDAADLVRMASEFGWTRVLVSDSDSHRDRATQFLCTFGLPAESFSAHLDGPDGKESAEVLLTSFDPDGFLPTALRRIILWRPLP